MNANWLIKFTCVCGNRIRGVSAGERRIHVLVLLMMLRRNLGAEASRAVGRRRRTDGCVFARIVALEGATTPAAGILLVPLDASVIRMRRVVLARLTASAGIRMRSVHVHFHRFILYGDARRRCIQLRSSVIVSAGWALIYHYIVINLMAFN